MSRIRARILFGALIAVGTAAVVAPSSASAYGRSQQKSCESGCFGLTCLKMSGMSCTSSTGKCTTTRERCALK